MLTSPRKILTAEACGVAALWEDLSVVGGDLFRLHTRLSSAKLGLARP